MLNIMKIHLQKLDSQKVNEISVVINKNKNVNQIITKLIKKKNSCFKNFTRDNIKLLHNGEILDFTKPVSKYNLSNNSKIFCFLSEKNNESNNNNYDYIYIQNNNELDDIYNIINAVFGNSNIHVDVDIDWFDFNN